MAKEGEWVEREEVERRVKQAKLDGQGELIAAGIKLTGELALVFFATIGALAVLLWWLFIR